MKELSPQELKDVQLHILDYIDAFCMKHQIKYTMSGGTLLGAIRHGGFIPWDDDVDIQMVRSEYKRFVELWGEKGQTHPYELVSIESGNNAGFSFGKVCDPQTVTYVGGVESTGLYVDVFPVDKVENERDWKFRHRMIWLLGHFHYTALLRLERKVGKLDMKKRIKMMLCPPLFSMKSLAATINSIAQKKENQECTLCFEMVSGFLCKKPIPSKVFDDVVPTRFENRMFLGVCDYDTYLKCTFGDYMKLPPEDKRVSHHDFIAYWKHSNIACD